MKIKIFENYIISKEREDILTSVCLYFEDIIPITKEEGFSECLFDDNNGLYKEYFTFYFFDFTEEEIYDRFYNFLKSLKLKVKNEKLHMGSSQIDVKVPEYKIKKYAYLFDMTKKYNL